MSRFIVALVAAWLLARALARAATPELSPATGLPARRYVAAGTRGQVLGFEDGRFYANGWHITGEMGGIITPPLKLLDALYFGVDEQWVGPATRFTSGWGYVRYDLPPIDGLALRRTDFAPDGRRGALIGLRLTNPARQRKAATVMVDAHSELMTQYPWSSTAPNAGDANGADTAAYRRHSLVFHDSKHRAYTAIVGSARRSLGGSTGPGHYGPYGPGRRCTPDQTPAPAGRQHGPGPLRAVRPRPPVHRGPDAGAHAEPVRRRPLRPRHRRPPPLQRPRPRARVHHRVDRCGRLEPLRRRGSQRVRQA